MNVGIIIQSRMGSKRLPGKNLLSITKDGTSLIELVILRLKKCKKIDQIIVATSKSKQNDILVKKIKTLGVSVFRGDEDDALERYYLAAKKFKIDNIIRITSDCALVDPKMVDEFIDVFNKKKLDYLSNTFNYNKFDLGNWSYYDGFDVEIFTSDLLNYVQKKHKKKLRVEGGVISPFFKQFPEEKKRIKFFIPKSRIFLNRIFKLSIDTYEDLKLVKKIYNYFYPDLYFNYDDVILYLKKYLNNPNISKNTIAIKKSERFILGQNMLVSKNHNMILPKLWPTYFSKTRGYNIWDLEGKKYSDLSLMGVGTNTLGYSNKYVDKAVKEVISLGNISTLNCYEEVKLAEKLLSLHPWFQKAKFARTGGEANSIAIRIARSNTQNTNVALCGYHGWHDWYLSSNIGNNSSLDRHLLKGLNPVGVPKELKNTSFTFKYGDFKGLEKLINEKKIGIIKMEVCRSTEPNISFLKMIRDICDKKKIILIFDECTSGFRETLGALHKKIGIHPDISIFGKALGNGYAITAILGKDSIMDSASKSFISSTFWTERIGPTAALKTLEIMEKIRSWEKITDIGKNFIKIWKKISKKNSLNIKIEGIPSLAKFFFEKDHLVLKTLLTQEFLKYNILGTNSIYACTSHDEGALKKYEYFLDKIFYKISNIYRDGNDPREYLIGEESYAPFSRLN